MTTLIQDVRYALRQLRKTPGFTFTVLLTLALGLGANAAIFTLVNSMLLQSLPVADPKTLVRLGDTNDCCVSGGTKDDGKYSLFPTDTYEYFKKNAPEFEELAAMQAGFGYRPITVRRDGAQTNARSVAGEFVSGNYFRTFGLQPRAGRLLTDSDDVKGAPMTAVMSYQAWKRDYNGDASAIGGTFWVNTKAGDGGGHCARRILRRPHVYDAARLLSANRNYASAGECSICARSWERNGSTLLGASSRDGDGSSTRKNECAAAAIVCVQV